MCDTSEISWIPEISSTFLRWPMSRLAKGKTEILFRHVKDSCSAVMMGKGVSGSRSGLFTEFNDSTAMKYARCIFYYWCCLLVCDFSPIVQQAIKNRVKDLWARLLVDALRSETGKWRLLKLDDKLNLLSQYSMLAFHVSLTLHSLLSAWQLPQHALTAVSMMLHSVHSPHIHSP